MIYIFESEKASDDAPLEIQVSDDELILKPSIKSKLSGGVLVYRIDYDTDKVATFRFHRKVNSDSKLLNALLLNITMEDVTGKIIEDKIVNLKVTISETKSFNKLTTLLQQDIKKSYFFRLTDQIIGADGYNYTIKIGHREGMRIGDTYLMYEWIQSGESSQKKMVGFGIIDKVSQPTPNASHTIFSQRLGDSQSIGGWIEEDPRRHLSTSLSPFYHRGLSLQSNSFVVTHESNTFKLLQKNYNAAAGLSLGISYGLYRILPISQVYLDPSPFYSLTNKCYIIT